MTIAERFIAESSSTSRAHPFFEQGMYSLFNDLEKIVKVLDEAGLAFELIGGVAVNTHILPLDRSRSFVTRDIDLLVRREDLAGIVQAGRGAGYEARRIVGEYMLIQPGQSVREAVHLIFSGERSRSTQPSPHPPLRPERKSLLGLTVPVAPLPDLVRMKLNSFRPKDLVHLEILDEVGLITPDLTAALPAELQDRLAMARRQFAENRPDVE